MRTKLNINSEVGKWKGIVHSAESDDAFAEKGIGIWGKAAEVKRQKA